MKPSNQSKPSFFFSALGVFSAGICIALWSLSGVVWGAGTNVSTPNPLTNNQGVLVRINGQALMRDEYLRKILDAIGTGQKDTAELRRNIFNEMVMTEVVRQEASRQRFDSKPSVVRTRDEKMIEVFLAEQRQKPVVVDEKDIAERYQQMLLRWGEIEWLIRSVAVTSEETRDKVLQALAEKKDFAEVAQQYSEAANKAQGGAIPWLTFPEPVKEGNTAGLPLAVAEALTKLNKGQYSQSAIKVGDQYVIIYVEGIRPLAKPEMTAVAPAIRAQLQQEKQGQAQQDYVLGLIQKAKIVPVDNQ